MVNFICQGCHTKYNPENLEIHRKKRGVDGGKYIPENCQVLCVGEDTNECHKMRDFI